MSEEWPLIDWIALTILTLAIARGLWIGLIREGLSLAAIGVCTIVTRLFMDPLALQLTEASSGELTGKAATWVAGVLLVMATIVACGIVARLMKRGAQFAGLGWADRIGGGALGLAEGSIIAAVTVLIAVWILGPDHAALENARSVEIVSSLRSAHDRGELPSVAAPGKWF